MKEIEAKIPRGVRNSNPLNIRKGNKWRGLRQNQTDKEFDQFINDIFGFRAAFKILENYIVRYRLNTIEAIVNRWAPATENHTEAYIKSVAKKSNIRRDVAINFFNRDMMLDLVWAMASVECGNGWFKWEDMVTAYDNVVGEIVN